MVIGVKVIVSADHAVIGRLKYYVYVINNWENRTFGNNIRSLAKSVKSLKIYKYVYLFI